MKALSPNTDYTDFILAALTLWEAEHEFRAEQYVAGDLDVNAEAGNVSEHRRAEALERFMEAGAEIR